MNFALERVTQPDIEPVALSEAKRYLRMFVDVTTEDDDITALIAAARQWVENYTGRALIDQTWRLSLNNRFGGTIGGDTVSGYIPGNVTPQMLGQYFWQNWLRRGEIMLHKSPVISIVSFVSVDQAGIETTIDPATYELREKDSKWPRIVPINGIVWPINGVFGGFRIVYRAGFADRDSSPQQDASVVPNCFKLSMKAWIDANYNRDQQMMWLMLKAAEEIIKHERADLQIA